VLSEARAAESQTRLNGSGVALGEGDWDGLCEIYLLLIYGGGRAAADCDFDKDGRPDLAIGQNGAETRLYHNVGAKLGLRVRLIGSAGNPYCIGVEMRLQFGQRPGPVRQISGGSGYWSVQVLSTPESPTSIWIRWPGGATNLVALKTDPRETRHNPEQP